MLKLGLSDNLLQKSLAVTLQKLLDKLPFDAEGRIAVNAHFRHSLEDAIELYTSSREEALGLLYKSQELTKNRSVELEADFEEVAASCGYFSFCLLDFANEMKVYLEILDDLKLEVEERPGGRSWKWLRFWRRYQKRHSKSANHDPGAYDLFLNVRLSIRTPVYTLWSFLYAWVMP